jgi:hypothetical protein
MSRHLGDLQVWGRTGDLRRHGAAVSMRFAGGVFPSTGRMATKQFTHDGTSK